MMDIELVNKLWALKGLAEATMKCLDTADKAQGNPVVMTEVKAAMQANISHLEILHAQLLPRLKLEFHKLKVR